MNVMGSRFKPAFVPLFRGHLVKYNYILIFYNIDTMASVAKDVDTKDKSPIDTTAADGSAATGAAATGADTAATGADTAADTAATGAATGADTAATGAEVAAKEDAKAVVGKTCVEPMGAKPTADGKYVMFDGVNYKVFTMPTDAAMLNDAAAGAKFFKVLPDETKGGKHKKQHKSAKKQRKLAKKQHKSAKKQRKSRSSRRSKK